TTLRSSFISPRAGRIDVAREVAVVAGIGIDDAADGAVLSRDFRLDSAEGTSITDDYDLAADVDALSRELFVVLLKSVIRIDELGHHIAIRRIRVVNRQLFRFLSRRRTFFQSRLFEFCCELLRRRHLEETRLGRGEENIEALDLGLIPPRAKQTGDE